MIAPEGHRLCQVERCEERAVGTRFIYHVNARVCAAHAQKLPEPPFVIRDRDTCGGTGFYHGSWIPQSGGLFDSVMGQCGWCRLCRVNRLKRQKSSSRLRWRPWRTNSGGSRE